MKKQDYSIWQNVVFVIKDFWGWQKILVIMGILRIPLMIFLPLLIALIPKVIIEILEAGGGAPQLLVAIPGMTVIAAGLYVADRVTKLWVEDSSKRAHYRYLVRVNETTIDMDYELLFSAEGKVLRAKALKMLDNQMATYLEQALVLLLGSGLGLIVYGSALALLSPWILVVLCISCVVTFYMNLWVNRYIESRRRVQAENRRRLDYVVFKAMDLAAAKDIRLYSLRSWLVEFGRMLLQKENRIVSQIALRRWCSMAVAALFILLRDGVAYVILIGQVLAGHVAVGDFLVYFTMIATFAEWVALILEAGSYLKLSSSCLSDLRGFWDLGASKTTPKARAQLQPVPEKEQWPCEIELRQVRYTYPESTRETLHGIDLTIKAGEKLAIVGLNGAGKTTLIKLLCGLFHPTEGQILVGGVDIAQMDAEAYFDLISVIFQDVHLLPTSIRTNITMQEKGKEDEKRLEQCLRQSGFGSSIQKLPAGLETMMVKNVNENAYELSGGELQKLLLARALYKKAPLMVLDEPTAALDPLAEAEVYRKFNQITQNKTAVYISHRLSSCRFCDDIVVLHQGRVVQQGSHDALVSQKEGLYFKLWQAQAQYYVHEEN